MNLDKTVAVVQREPATMNRAEELPCDRAEREAREARVAAALDRLVPRNRSLLIAVPGLRSKP